jgi:hypothetical protein
MRTLHAAGFAAVLAATALVAPGAATAAPPTTYSGSFAGSIQYVGCTEGTPPSPGIAGGTWSVDLQRSSAKGTFAITLDGVKHVSYVYPGMTQAPVTGSTTFSVYGETQAGTLTVTLKRDRLAYTIAPYNYGGLSCVSVTFPGTLG